MHLHLLEHQLSCGLSPQSCENDEKVLDKFFKRAVFANNLLQLSIDTLKVTVGGIQKNTTFKLQAKHPFTLNGNPVTMEVTTSVGASP